MSVTTIESVHFHAGWNFGGCLPEMPYEAFRTADEAARYLIDEMDRNECTCGEGCGEVCTDDATGERCAECNELCEPCVTIECVRSAYADGDLAYGFSVANESDGYVYCVQRCTDPACAPFEISERENERESTNYAETTLFERTINGKVYTFAVDRSQADGMTCVDVYGPDGANRQFIFRSPACVESIPAGYPGREPLTVASWVGVRHVW